MNECFLPTGITALACAIAKEIEDTNQLIMLGAILGQLGSVLSTIASQRNLIEDKNEAGEPLE